MTSIDTHAHVFRAGRGIASDARYSPSHSATPEQFLTHLDRHGMSHGVLVQPSFLGTDNRQLIEAIADSSGRLRGVAVVEPTITDAELRDLADQGLCGARLNLFGRSVPDLRAGDWPAFLDRLQRHGWHLELHAPPDYLAQVLPQVRAFTSGVVIDHLGRIDPDLGIDDPAYRRVLDLLDPSVDWVKMSGWYRLGHTPNQGLEVASQAMDLLRDRGMTPRLLWGSDWPHTQHEQVDYDQAVAAMQVLLPDEAERDMVLGANAMELFGFAD